MFRVQGSVLGLDSGRHLADSRIGGLSWQRPTPPSTTLPGLSLPYNGTKVI